MTNPADQPQGGGTLPKRSDLAELARRPVRLIAHPTWSEACETALALVTAGPALIVVLGPPGTGKTALLHHLATTFGEHGRAVCLLDFGDSPLDVGIAEIVLVDEADRLSATRLSEFRRHGLAIILAALPATRERFDCYPDATIVQLAPLSAGEARAFLAERLAQLGLPNGCLTEPAWAQLIAHSHGVPRLLVALFRLALFIAGEEQAEHVTDAHVEKAIEIQGGGPDASTTEPADAKPDPSQPITPEPSGYAVPASTGGFASWVSEPPSHLWRRRVAVMALLAVVYLAPSATLVSWLVRQMDKSASSALDVPESFQTQVPTLPRLGSEQSAEVTASGAPVSPAPVVTLTSPPQPTAQTQTSPAVTAIILDPPGAISPSGIRGNLQTADATSLKVPRPPLLEAGGSPVIDRDTPARLVPRTGQAELTPAAAQVSELEATITRRTKDIETLVAQRNQLQSQIRQLSFEISDATRRLSEVHRQVMQAEKAKIAAQHATPIIAHQPFPPVSYRELPSISPRPTREAPIPVRQLLSARRALVENNSPEARGLLESAQTSIIFEPGDVAPERASVAAAQIADALSMLNSGHTMGALPYLNRAITAMQPVF